MNIATGNSGIFFQYSNGRGECSGSIYLLTKTGRYIEQINACAFGDESKIDSFELMTGLKINVHYDLGGIKKQKIISVKM